jgi:signal transduction histidine kinase/ligand-binding sensor domain-containing protein
MAGTGTIPALEQIRRMSSSSTRTSVVRSVGIALLLLAITRVGYALDAVNLLTQYAHSAWTPQEYGLAGTPLSIAQTTDGYLWIGTTAGLVRFDGVKFVTWTAPAGQELSSQYVVSLLAASDGSLWIGTLNGLSRWQHGKLQRYALGPGSINAIFEDANRDVWIGRGADVSPDARACRVDSSHLRCYTAATRLELPTSACCVFSFLRDPQGSLWIAGDTALVRWKESGFTTYRPAVLQTNQGQAGAFLAETRSGALLVGMTRSGPGGGLQRMTDGELRPFALPGFDGSQLEVTAIYVDRNDDVWIGTPREGLYRIHDRRVERFRSSDGLTSDNVYAIVEDREGDVWVVTSRGIDNFRDLHVTTFSPREGLMAEEVDSVSASSDGSLWIGSANGVNVLRHGVWSVIRAREGFPGLQVTSMLEDHEGHLWIGADTGMSVYENSRFNPVLRPDGAPLGMVVGMAEDTKHDVWLELAGVSPRLLHLRDRKVLEEITAPPLPAARKLLPDSRGGIWLGMTTGDLAYRDGSAAKVFSYPRTSNHPVTPVIQLQTGSDGTVYGATESGLIGWKDGVRRTMTAHNGLPCTRTFALVFDLRGNLWLYMECGLVEVQESDVGRWWIDGSAMVRPRLYDQFDGAQPGLVSFNGAARTTDGRLWFANGAALQVIDPARIGRNAVPPPIHIEGVVADRVSYAPRSDLRLPALTRDLEIDYTALSFAMPQKVRFRYRLDGYDDDWRDSGTRRQAFYSNLPPRSYRFRVAAVNNDGVWSETDAQLQLTIPPAFYQTGWFKVFCAAAVVAVICLTFAVYAWQLKARLRGRVAERMIERERIARELHDTFLQSVQGLMLRFQVAMEKIPHSEPARQLMSNALSRADDVLVEGRERVTELRTAGQQNEDLPQALQEKGAELAQLFGGSFHLTVEGVPCLLRPEVAEEVERIGGEALNNAFRHARAGRISAQIQYAPDYFCMRICDDGVGFDMLAWNSGGQREHWGLLGMRERAHRIRARIEITSRPGQGTAVELRVRGATAFEHLSNPWRRWLWLLLGRG